MTAESSGCKLKSNCILKRMRMTLALTLIDMWLYRVIGGLILSCGPHCAVLLNHEVYQVWFSANDRYAKQAFFFFHPYQAFKTVQHQAKHSRQMALHAHRGKPLSDGMTLLCEDMGELGAVA